MLELVYQAIYGIPYWVLLISAAAVFVLAFLAELKLSLTAKRVLGMIGLVIATAIILYTTMLRRSEADMTPILMPGYSISRAFWNGEYRRMVIMNIALFVPYGIFFPMAFGNRRLSRVLKYGLISGFALTFLIEILQYLFYLGCAETDDVICNFLGVIIGLIPYVIACIIKRGRRA